MLSKQLKRAPVLVMSLKQCHEFVIHFIVCQQLLPNLEITTIRTLQKRQDVLGLGSH